MTDDAPELDPNGGLAADLAFAFLQPTTAERPELAAAVLRRVRRADRRRRLVILGAGLSGAAVAAGAVVSAGLFDTYAFRAVVVLASSEAALAALGLTVIVLAAGRHAWSDA